MMPYKAVTVSAGIAEKDFNRTMLLVRCLEDPILREMEDWFIVFNEAVVAAQKCPDIQRLDHVLLAWTLKPNLEK